MKAQIPNSRLREMVKNLVDEHKELGYEKLKLAVWFGEKDNVSDVYLFEVIENHPESFSGYLDTYEFGPSEKFAARLHLVIAAPEDIDDVILNSDKTLIKILSSEPEIIFNDTEGEKIWEKINNAS